jgi:hypothetical protein
MRKISTRLLLALTLSLLASCAAPPSDTGTVQFAVSVPQALSSSISRVSVTSSAADIPSVSVDLATSNGIWGGILGNIPAGADRSFLAQAFDSSGTKLFEGSASGVSIVANQTSLVAITLQQVNAPPPFQNAAPFIDSLVSSSTSVSVGGSLSLVATAHDPNPGDTLSYAWSSTAGAFSSASAASTTWTAPAFAGMQTLTLTVTDPGGLSSSVSLRINVLQSGGQGDAQLFISFNSSPIVASVSATVSQLAVGQTTSVSASASDLDGDSLSYSWSASCAGSWTQASSSSAQFTPSALPASACNNCNLTVSVSDGRGGQTTGTLALCVTNTPTSPIPSHSSPLIIRSYRSSNSAAPGQVLTYEVVASDPEGSALSFSWASNTGSLGAPANGSFNSRITWTAPSCASASAPPLITATVTNAFYLTATQSFSVVGLPGCASWTSTGSMASSHYLHSSMLLPNGTVLVSGGYSGGNYLATAEVYSPASGAWSATSSMLSPRYNHTSALLPNGKVLTLGGENNSGYLATAEVYDPASGTWSATGSMALKRSSPVATLLPNGKVLVVGGVAQSGLLAAAELYDPASGTWSATGSMSAPRSEHTATLLPNGQVLVAGGVTPSGASARVEIYNPASGTWSATGSMASPRYAHTATLLPGGKILVAGGYGSGNYLADAEVYEPASGTWSDTGLMASPRTYHTATPLPGGKVLVVGGYGGSDYLATGEMYDPASGTWSNTGSMASARYVHTAALLQNGKVLVLGGYNGSYLSTAELYTP